MIGANKSPLSARSKRVRLAIMSSVAAGQPVTCTEVAAAAGVSQEAVSSHMRILAQRRLVERLPGKMPHRWQASPGLRALFTP